MEVWILLGNKKKEDRAISEFLKGIQYFRKGFFIKLR